MPSGTPCTSNSGCASDCCVGRVCSDDPTKCKSNPLETIAITIVVTIIILVILLIVIKVAL